jgi:hypothetical protein
MNGVRCFEQSHPELPSPAVSRGEGFSMALLDYQRCELADVVIASQTIHA